MDKEDIYIYSTYLQWSIAAAAAKSLQSCPTLCDPIDGSPPGSPVPGILQARTLEWVAISFSNSWKWKVKVKSLSRAPLLATPWTAATRLLRPWDFPGKSTGVRSHCLLHNGVLLSHKRTKFESVVVRWMNLEPLIKSELNQKEKNKYSILTCIYGI